jgi:hypothetical protein
MPYSNQLHSKIFDRELHGSQNRIVRSLPSRPNDKNAPKNSSQG